MSLSLLLAFALSQRSPAGLFEPQDVSSNANGRECRWRTWRQAQPVSVSALGSVARPPRLAVGRQRIYVVGADVQRIDDQVVRENPLTVLELGGRKIEPPSGRFFFLYPRGALDAEDRLHLLWAEPAAGTGPIQARQWIFLRPAALWTAIYDTKTGWTIPTRLDFPISGIDGIRWQPLQPADNLGANALQGIGLEEMRRRTNSPLQYATLEVDGSWKLHTIPVPRSAAYVSVARDTRRMFAAFVQADPEWASSPLNVQHSDVNSVFLIISLDGGQTWTDPRRITLSGQYPASEVAALLGSNGVLHLVWKQETPAGKVIRHAISDDGGSSWSKIDELRIDGQFENQRTVIDGCGAVHLVYEDWSRGMDRIHIDYVRWDHGWADPVHLFESSLAMAPDIRLAVSGEPIVTFVASNRAKANGQFATYFARMTR